MLHRRQVLLLTQLVDVAFLFLRPLASCQSVWYVCACAHVVFCLRTIVLLFLQPGLESSELVAKTLLGTLSVRWPHCDKADREAEGRRVRQMLYEMETRLDWSESVGRSHEQCVSFQESPQRIVLCAFACVPENFWAGQRGGDFKVAKRAFIGGVIHELCEKSGAEVNQFLDEAEGFLAEPDGWGVLGVYPTDGMWGEVPDGLLRLQPGYVGDSGWLLTLHEQWFFCLRHTVCFRIGLGNPKARVEVRTRAIRETKAKAKPRTMELNLFKPRELQVLQAVWVSEPLAGEQRPIYGGYGCDVLCSLFLLLTCLFSFGSLFTCCLCSFRLGILYPSCPLFSLIPGFP